MQLATTGKKVRGITRKQVQSLVIRPIVKYFMTPSPHAIGAEQTLARAHEMMRDHDIRHLPVLQGGHLVGVLSQRDLYLIETFGDSKPETILVSEAMSTEVFTVGPDASVARVSQEMAKKKYGCAVVMCEGRLDGIFTTIDAIQALNHYIRRATARHP